MRLEVRPRDNCPLSEVIGRLGTRRAGRSCLSRWRTLLTLVLPLYLLGPVILAQGPNQGSNDLLVTVVNLFHVVVVVIMDTVFLGLLLFIKVSFKSHQFSQIDDSEFHVSVSC